MKLAATAALAWLAGASIFAVPLARSIHGLTPWERAWLTQRDPR